MELLFLDRISWRWVYYFRLHGKPVHFSARRRGVWTKILLQHGGESSPRNFRVPRDTMLISCHNLLYVHEEDIDKIICPTKGTVWRGTWDDPIPTSSSPTLAFYFYDRAREARTWIEKEQETYPGWSANPKFRRQAAAVELLATEPIPWDGLLPLFIWAQEEFPEEFPPAQ